MQPVLAVDPCTDQNAAALYQLDLMYDIPVPIKQAFSKIARTDMPPQMYADERGKRFPCHSAEATMLSQLYFQEKQASLPQAVSTAVRSKLEKLAAHFRVQPIPRKQIKQAAYDPADYAFVLPVVEGKEAEVRLPIRTETEVQQAIGYMQRHDETFALMDKSAACRRILTKAAQLAVSLSAEDRAYLQTCTGQGIPDVKVLDSELTMRSRLCKSAEHKAALSQLQEKLQDKELLKNEGSRHKLACALDLLDRDVEAAKYGCRPAERLLHGIPYVKLAAAVDDTFALITQSLYSKQALRALALDDVGDLLGDSIRQHIAADGEMDVEKAAEVFATLPRVDAELLEDLLKTAGVQPLKEKEAGLASSELGEAARRYQPGKG